MTQISLSELFSHKHNPYPIYAQLREQVPLARFRWMGTDMWLLAGYDQATTILKDPRFTMDWQKVQPAQTGRSDDVASSYMPLAWSKHLLNTDPPDHTRLRTLVSKAFIPRMIEQLRPRIQQLMDGLLDTVQAQGEMDLVAGVAVPLPIAVISDLLGIPVEDRKLFRTWTQIIVQSQGAAPGQGASGLEAEKAFVRYIKTLITNKSAHPDNDLTSQLVLAEEAGDRLNEDELISMIFLLITAGHETTVNLIANGMLALLEHPDQMRLLCADSSLLPGAVEELLRYTSPVTLSGPRWALEDVSLYGQVIHKGEMVRCALLAANTDPQQFPDPDVLDILRRENQHVAFGKGIHFCLGAPLARLEGQIAIGTLLRRLPHLRLACDPQQLTWKEGGSLRNLVSLPVTF
ncbi:cytochrome P450 [Dictyobacter sp. S3.2.2.5]|uniref:Cytochrome P450 n=1 Tax=Dictyobacter halimunensis TaxID=3026934 RepID=A0ABQ6FHZ7_9CHLR|nr:cytochrome P450 [Dictyobacter sp. S3.2.2.5]